MFKYSTPQLNELVRAAQAGDIAARDEVVAASMPLLYMLANKYRTIRSIPTEADDLAQEAAIHILRAIKNWDGTGSFRTVIDYYAKRGFHNANRHCAFKAVTPPKQQTGYSPASQHHAAMAWASHKRPGDIIGEDGEIMTPIDLLAAPENHVERIVQRDVVDVALATLNSGERILVARRISPRTCDLVVVTDAAMHGVMRKLRNWGANNQHLTAG